MPRDPFYAKRARELRRNQNSAEICMWSILRAHRMAGFKFRRQLAVGRYIADFVCLRARLVIEVDGDIHGDDHHEALDAKRTQDIEGMGYRVIRFWNHEVLTATDDVRAAIYSALGPHPDPLPLIA